jgi:MFS family permease
MINEHTENVIAGMGARVVDGVIFNIFAVFSIGYLSTSLHVSHTTALLGVTIAAIVMCATIPFFGWLSDIGGRTAVYGIASLLVGFSTFPAFFIFVNDTANTTAIWLAIIIPFGILYAAVYGPEAALFSELFPAPVRYTGISFVYQFSGIFVSGLTPIVATALLHYSGAQNPWLICGYCALSGVISALSALWIRNTARRNALTAAPIQGGIPESDRKTQLV